MSIRPFECAWRYLLHGNFVTQLFYFFPRRFNAVTAWEQNGNSPNLISLTVQPNGVTFLLTNPSAANYQQYWTSSGMTQSQVIAVGEAINDLLMDCKIGGCVGEADGCVAYTAATSSSWPPNCVSCECPIDVKLLLLLSNPLPMRNSLSYALIGVNLTFVHLDRLPGS